MAVWQAQRVRPKAKHRGAVGNCRTGAQHRLSTGSSCGQDSCPRRARPSRCAGAGKALRSFLQPVTLALERQQGRAVHQSIQNGRAHRVVTQVFAPVLNDSVGGHHYRAAQFVAPMNHRLQQLGGTVRDAPGKEQIIKNQQVWLQHPLREAGADGQWTQP